jgi:hypothetical protein
VPGVAIPRDKPQPRSPPENQPSISNQSTIAAISQRVYREHGLLTAKERHHE